jgi:GMP synthase (glutamine-hydrolysing)
MPQIIAVLDFGSQLTQVIARRIRECQVYSKIFHYATPAAKLKEEGVIGIIFSGGPQSVYAKTAPHPDPELFKLGVPILGICYGVQLMGHHLGGHVAHSKAREYGHGHLTIKKPGKLFAGLPRRTAHLEFPRRQTRKTAAGLRRHGGLGQLPIRRHRGYEAPFLRHPVSPRGFPHRARRGYDSQFPPRRLRGEAGLDDEGLHHAVDRHDSRTGRQGPRAPRSFRRRRFLSGRGVVAQGIGKQLTCVFVDNGLLRKGEREAVESLYARHFKIDLRVVDASALFLRRLKGVSEPEQKRKIIGRTFVEVFEKSLKSIKGRAEFLGQGTLYPDVIESVSIAGNPASLIKTHHNVGGLPSG